MKPTSKSTLKTFIVKMWHGCGPAWVWLLLVLLLYFTLWIVCPQEFSASDPWSYSKRAYAISQDFNFYSSHVFSHRLGVTIPVAFFYSVFGVNIITTNLWSLCAALITIMTVWLALPDDKSKILGAILCLTSVPLFNSSVVLYPDMISGAFMASSSLVLFNRWRLIQSRRTWMLASLVAVSFLFLAFLAKESAYWVLPLWAWALFSDFKEKDRNVLIRRFYLPALGTGIFLGIMYLVFCQLTWGDPLARFKSIQELTGIHLWSWDKVSGVELWKRLTVGPVRMLRGQYPTLILLLAIIGLFTAPRSIRPWGQYAVCCLLFFWFGSTSFSRYEPMPLVPRMILPMLPALYILAAFTLSRYSVASDRVGWILPVFGKDVFLGVFGLSISPNRVKWISRFFPIIVVLALTGLPFVRCVRKQFSLGKETAELAAMSIVRREVKDHPDRNFLLVCADERSPESLSFYFSYQYPENLHVVSCVNLTDALIRSNEEVLFFVNRKLSKSLKNMYGTRNYDDEIDILGLTVVYESGDVVLLRSDEPEQLKNLMAPSVPSDK